MRRRFHQDENVCEAAEIDRDIPPSPLYRRLTLRPVRELSAQPGALTIEFRCTVSPIADTPMRPA